MKQDTRYYHRHILRTAGFSVALLTLCGAGGLIDDAFTGINLPPRQGTTNAGAFRSGIYRLDYSSSDLAKLKNGGFNFLRIPINVETARDPASLKKIAGYFDLVGNRGIICLFDTRKDDEGSHGDGKPDDLELLGKSWALIHARFKDHSGIKYELFNEPFGYSKTEEGARHYVRDMRQIIRLGGLPEDRCILDGVGYADNVHLVAQAGWTGELAYHFYPMWVPEGHRTQERYSSKLHDDLKGLSHLVHVTEFGANLQMGDSYNRYTADGSEASKDRNTLRGFHDALIALKRAGKGVKSTCYWHGWNNGDSYDFWDSTNHFGADKVRAIQQHN